MIKNITIALLLTFSLNVAIGQNSSDKKDNNIPTFISMDVNPTIYVVIDSIQHKIDGKKADDIKTKWIDRTIVMKDKTTKKIYGNKNGAVFIYIKEEYNTEALKEVKKDSGD